MTPEKQRSEIAKLCGWRLQNHVPTECEESAIMCWIRPKNDEWHPEQLPDYLNDLNACYEFTAHMTYDQQVEFAEILHSIVLENPYKAWWNPTAHETFQLLDASAAQRCEAFLKVFNKWESQP